MSNLISPWLIPSARKHLRSTMTDSVTVQRTGVTVPALVIVTQKVVPHRDMPERLRVRKWKIMMPDASDAVWSNTKVRTGDRLVASDGRIFLVTEITDANTYNVSTQVMSVLANAVVTFRRPIVPGLSVGPVDVYIARVAPELRQYGILYEWEVWFDSSIVFPGSPLGGNLISKEDEMNWVRTPNPFPNRGNAVLDKPRYAYGEGPVVAAYFKEPL